MQWHEYVVWALAIYGGIHLSLWLKKWAEDKEKENAHKKMIANSDEAAEKARAEDIAVQNYLQKKQIK
jgi:hypothetical protein